MEYSFFQMAVAGYMMITSLIVIASIIYLLAYYTKRAYKSKIIRAILFYPIIVLLVIMIWIAIGYQGLKFLKNINVNPSEYGIIYLD